MMALPNGCMSRRMHVAMRNTARACSISIIAGRRLKARGICTRSHVARGACMMANTRARASMCGPRAGNHEAPVWVKALGGGRAVRGALVSGEVLIGADSRCVGHR
ncbi:hypothetical protein DN581_30310 [Burkholderia multivorans]|nr:hypothetical protein DN528_29195 [Burkholderia multivorans]RAE05782.1 hypothetical protein DN581_30310 [Burkholderia multivorans]RAF15435.1 hypothetical protein DN532_29940 [Burkholderia multivorans]RAF50332.1 hypothetical protein DN570_28095 [Burkholderia multivorans]